MKLNIYLSLLVCTVLVITQSCTTAIIDEGDINSLPPLTRTVTYQSDVESIMFNNCITCHGGQAPASGLDLSTFINTKNAAEQRNLIQRINDITNPMPEQGLMPPEIRQIMDKWVADGYLEQ